MENQRPIISELLNGSASIHSETLTKSPLLHLDTSRSPGVAVGESRAIRGTMATRGFRALLDVVDVRRQSERFFRFVTPEPNTGCHLWTGCYDHRFEYGQFKLWPQKVIAMAHRVAWVIAHGRIPELMEVDHLCRNKWCVNVAHLDLATRRENLRRRDAYLASIGTHNLVAAHAALRRSA